MNDEPRVRIIAGDSPELANEVIELHQRQARERRVDRLMKALLSVPPPSPKPANKEPEQ